MKRLLPTLLLLIALPAVGWSQGLLQVSSMTGKVEVRTASGRTFQTMTASTRQVQVGDEIRTGSGASVVLTLPDSSYMVVTENSNLVIRDFWSGGVRSLVNLTLGRVRFYVEKLGGRPNPYRVETPTALIAVRGTEFDVVVDGSFYTEVVCLDGQVAVESVGLPDREVILSPGRHTLVAPGQYPLTPVSNDVALVINRTLRIQKKDAAADDRGLDPRRLEDFLRDNDRASRPSDRNSAPGSQSDPNSGRAKPSVTFP